MAVIGSETTGVPSSRSNKEIVQELEQVTRRQKHSVHNYIIEKQTTSALFTKIKMQIRQCYTEQLLVCM